LPVCQESYGGSRSCWASATYCSSLADPKDQISHLHIHPPNYLTVASFLPHTYKMASTEESVMSPETNFTLAQDHTTTKMDSTVSGGSVLGGGSVLTAASLSTGTPTYTNFTLAHDPTPKRLRQYLCNKYLVGAPPWQKVVAVCSVVGLLSLASLLTMPPPMKHYNIAFIGNSMMYYNDFPRFMSALSDSHISQDCCLHGDADLTTILNWGSGTYQIWHTGVARMEGETEDDQVYYEANGNYNGEGGEQEDGNDNNEEDDDDDDGYNKTSWYGYSYTSSNQRILYDMVSLEKVFLSFLCCA